MKRFFNKKVGRRGICGVLLLAAVLSVALGACGDKKPQDTSVTSQLAGFVFASGVTVENTDVGGMSYEEALKAVQSSAEKGIADFLLTVNAEDKSFDYKKSDFRWTTDAEAVLTEAVRFCQSTEFDSKNGYSADVKAKADDSSVKEVVDSIAAEVDVEAVDSTIAVEGGQVKISREKSGRSLDKADLTKKISQATEALSAGGQTSLSVEATVNDIEPKYNLEGLSSEIKLIASYTTYSTNNENGNHNMKLALEACDGSVINPGETWSFNECTGDSNQTSLGYLPATVIVNGQFEDGIGGGLCQASTTIYNAALLANMTVEERYCHQFQSSYVPAGRDATIDYPSLDLKLSNPTDYPMYMQCYMDGTELTVNIFGWDDPSFDYIEIESSVYGATSEGYKASAQRVYYLDGEEVKREDLPSSWYDYPDNGGEEPTKATKPKATVPKETKPKATTPKVTKPKETQAPATKPQPKPTVPVTEEPTEPIEITTLPPETQVTVPNSNNDQQIATATANY